MNDIMTIERINCPPTGLAPSQHCVARVWLKDGSGQFVVNSKPLIEYFQPMQRQDITLPFAVSGASCLFDVICTVKGGGISGKA